LECAARLSVVEWVTYVSRYVPSFAWERQRLRDRDVAAQEERGADWWEGRMAERRTVRYRSVAIDFARMQLHMQSPCAYIPRGQVVLSGSACTELRASESERDRPQLIKPPRNLYRHYTRCFACKNHLRRTPDCSLVLASRQQQRGARFCTARDCCRYNNWVWIDIIDVYTCIYSKCRNAKLISLLLYSEMEIEKG